MPDVITKSPQVCEGNFQTHTVGKVDSAMQLLPMLISPEDKTETCAVSAWNIEEVRPQNMCRGGECLRLIYVNCDNVA